MVSSACVAYHQAWDDPAETRVSKAIRLLASTDSADQVCYHIVMSMCAELGYLQEALQVQKRMEKAGFPSNASTYRILTDKCIAIGLLEHAMFFKKRMEEMSDDSLYEMPSHAGL